MGGQSDDVKTVLGLAGRLDKAVHRKLSDIVSTGGNVFSRSEMRGHVTVSACVVSADCTAVMMIDSPKFQKLLLPGGHVDSGESLMAAAARELQEECGLSPTQVRPLCDQPVAMNAHWIAASPSRGEAGHEHFDVHALFKSLHESLTLSLDPREASAYRWVKFESLTTDFPELSKYLLGGMKHG